MTDIETKELMRPIRSSQFSLAENPPSESAENAAQRDAPMTMHPFVVATALAGWAWALVAFWIVFLVLGSATALVNMVMVTFISLAVLGLLVGCGWSARNVATRGNERLRQPMSFREFLDGEVEIATGRIKGSEAYMMALAMAVTLAVIGTGLAVAIGVA